MEKQEISSQIKIIKNGENVANKWNKIGETDALCKNKCYRIEKYSKLYLHKNI